MPHYCSNIGRLLNRLVHITGGLLTAGGWLACIPLLYGGLGVLGRLAGLGRELFNKSFLVVPSLHTETALLTLKALELDLVLQESVCRRAATAVVVVALCKSLLVAAVLNVDGETLGRQETEPLQSLLIKAGVREGVLPMGNAQVHDHETEIVREGVRKEEPSAAQVLEPDLGLALVILSLVDQSQATILALVVNLESENFTAKSVTSDATYSSSSSSLDSLSISPRVPKEKPSPLMRLMSLNLLRCMTPSGRIWSFFLIFQPNCKPSLICKKALKSSGN